MILACATGVRADLDNWTWGNPWPQGNALNGVSWQQGQFVAVGDRGTVLTSSDGVNWTLRETDIHTALHGVASNGKLWVVVGSNGAILTSSDGLKWSAMTAANGFSLMAVASNGTQFVAVGYQGTVLTSSDGVIWETCDVSLSSYFNTVIWDGQEFVVPVPQSGQITSVDGRHWVNHKFTQLDYVNGLATNGSRWVAAGKNISTNPRPWFYSPEPGLYTSADGDSWTACNGASNDMAGIGWGSNQFAGVGSIGVILTSVDGVTWTNQSSPTRYDLTAVVWGGGQWATVGGYGTVLTSSDGIQWTDRTQDRSGLANRDPSGTQFHLVHNGSYGTWAKGLTGLAWNGSLVVAVGPAGAILTSADGTAWASHSLDNDQVDFNGIAVNENRFVAVGTGGIYTSPDGEKWTKGDCSGCFSGIMWTGGQFVAVGSGGIVATSPDGLTWTNHGFTSGTLNDLLAVTAGAGQIVAGGKNGVILTSTDGATWTQHNAGSNQDSSKENFTSIAWSGKQFIALAASGKMIASPDGVTWTQINPDIQYARLTSIQWAHGQFIAVGSGTVDQQRTSMLATSPDGLQWTIHSIGTANGMNALTWTNTKVVVAGDGGSILSADNGGAESPASQSASPPAAPISK